MTKPRYRPITIPSSLYRALAHRVQASGGYYVSIAEMVREALRDFLAKQRLDM
jgi:Arc/MetJ-type ribon-helix-helix transcriptional regulator